MKRTIEYSPAYLKKARKLALKNPQLREQYSETLNKITDNPFDPSLRTHALTGDLKGKYACSA
jgi:mRNA-degrading endonuclease YafQ of YafQ-DinJ toxin-antitoxin module